VKTDSTTKSPPAAGALSTDANPEIQPNVAAASAGYRILKTADPAAG
jgi:hypothetical protein